MIDYSIILVNYKSAALILNCLETIYENPASNFEVIIVDNCSDDDSKEQILDKFPIIRWVQMSYNSGFARGNNAGILIAQGDIILLLNSDTLIVNNAIDSCFQRFQKGKHIAAGVQLLNADNTPQISGNYFMTGGLNHLMNLPVTGPVLRALGLFLKVKKTNVLEAQGEVEVDWINGAFLMVKKSAIDKAGMLDEDFFLFSEEIEWCYRLGKQGSLAIYGDLNVIHLMGATVGKAFNSSNKGYSILHDRKGYQIMLSGLVRVRKQFGVAWFLFHLLIHWGTIPVYFIASILKSLVGPHYFLIIWRRFSGFSGNVIKVTSYAYRIIANRSYFYKVL